jgi:hypothetical protein
MGDRFPSAGFFRELERRIGAEKAHFEALGFFDCTFGVRVLGGGGAPDRLFVLEFDTYACRSAREVPQAAPPDGVDFVLEAPEAVWREMLASAGATGAIDAEHTINTLTHYDRPIHVESATPEGHDKLFRFQESVQHVFDIAAAVERSAS